MDNELSTHYIDYIPADEIVSLLGIDRSELIFRAMRKHVEFVYPLKSEKLLTYYPITKVKNTLQQLYLSIRTFLPFGLDNRQYPPGHLIKITDLRHLNAIGLNVLNESSLLARVDNGKKALLRYEKLRNTFHKIDFDDLLIPIESAENLSKRLHQERDDIALESFEENNGTIKKETKQAKREKVFINWLSDKNTDKVSNMKKDDVWEELRKLDPHLFSSEPKNFFRIQQIITFKSGRKLNK
jgi:hypothetical protein